jgi:cytochrome c
VTKRQWMMIVMLVLCVGWIPLLFIPTGPHKDAKTLIAELPAPYNTGDPAKGQDAFQACIACHTTTEHGQRTIGPNLYRVFERRAGTGTGFTYSPAMKQAAFHWDAKQLDAFIADPQGVVPHTLMALPGIQDPKARIDLIAFLKAATS